MKYLTLIAALAQGCLQPAYGQNSLVSGGMTIEEVSAILESEGLSARAGTGGEAGSIASAVNGTSFKVDSYNCNSRGRCTEFLFIAGFDLDNGFPMERINKWNSEELGGRAFLDHENDPFLDHVVSVSGPQDKGAFLEGLYLWASALSAFVEFIDLPLAES